ncbi:hypothetical protein AMIS_70740 [Actinoplanes missouriensis 431]|uniref:Gram-positive cocci surface proteins LPxTG domain-containing protein n=1 Tax=Actinoplanes missouriensis (strain ATCC 14538 / DSM 43046 / CBS 188.64 / JCM 3121 / NBRC 102363 / NCIMB 12654 / NRRL B-3342 / UNCC 431) TaxID=512565 RepID=I0HH07_ACTM4|nr:hypothetical protein [Actinoplanes missouriensis]BAL92294.1 hypothetical protein AMIS_70740 [Actinoplanes missouriensis 431]
MRTTPLRRAALVAAGALLGLTGLIGVASPASATNHGSEPLPGCVSADKAPLSVSGWQKGKTDAVVKYDGPAPLCQDLVVNMLTYTATSSSFKLPQYLFDSQTLQIKKDATSGTLEFSGAEVPGCFAQIDLVRGERIINPLKSDNDLYGDRKLKWWNGGEGECSAKPVAEPIADCTGAASVKLINPQTTKETTFDVTAEGGFTKTVVIEPNDFGTVEIPADNAKNIVVKANGKELYNGTPSKPEDCPKPQPTPAVLTPSSTCDGLTFTVKNPGDGKDVTVTFTPSQGNGDAKVVTLKPGQDTEVTFPAKENLAVTVSGDITASNGVVTWTKPEECETPVKPSTPASEGPSEQPSEGPSEEPSATPSESVSESASPSVSATTSTTPVATTPVSDNEDGGSLPVTGAAAGGIAGGAALLLVVGAGLFFMARRRKLNFKA